MLYFSEEIALHILELLTPAELAQCACVARQWHRLVNDQMLWRRLFYKDQFIYPRGLRNAGRIPKSTRPGSILSQDRRSLKRKRAEPNSYHHHYRQQQHYRQEEYMIYGDPSANLSPCWKALYRLNHNWIAGQAQVTSLSIQQLSHQDQLVLDTAGNSLDGDVEAGRGDREVIKTHSPIVQFQGPVLLVVSPGDMVHLWRIKPATSIQVPEGDRGSLSSPKPLLWDASTRKPEFWQTYRSLRRARGQGGGIGNSTISCLALDRSTAAGDSTGWQKVMVGYNSGHFSVFEYSRCQEQSELSDSKKEASALREIGNTVDLPAWSDVGGIQSASFLYPILTTCSNDGSISIYKIQEDNHESLDPSAPRHWCRLLHRLYGSSPLSPVEMELRLVVAQHQASSVSTTRFEQDQQHIDNTTRTRWRALIAFGLQLMDGSWTVRLQDIEFDELFIRHSTETGIEDESGLQEASATQQEGGDADADEETNLRSKFPSSVESLGSRSELAGHARIGTISAITISSPYVVTTHPDNTMNVFHMARSSTTYNKKVQAGGSIYPSPTRFRHLSTLYGHCGAVSSVAIESRSGRLVSASMDRSIKVWTMVGRNSYDQLEQRRVHQCALSMNDLNQSWTLGAQVNREEGLGLVWVGTDDEKIVSMNSDGTVKVWLFS
ncbi:RNA-dependent ATPase rok1 [Linnemannia zychae]|nr:RNA-dependent ATPase rok1 [Linnemannia zychae]